MSRVAELFEALDNDPFVIAEYLARPILTERLIADTQADSHAKICAESEAATNACSAPVMAQVQGGRQARFARQKILKKPADFASIAQARCGKFGSLK